MKNKIMRYRIKNCEDCAYWNSLERFNPQEFCVDHRDLEDQPLGILKAIKKEKRQMWNWIILFGVIFLFSGLFFAIAMLKSNVVYSVIYGIFLSFPIWMIIDVIKHFQKELKALNQKKNEWIIEYE